MKKIITIILLLTTLSSFAQGKVNAEQVFYEYELYLNSICPSRHEVKIHPISLLGQMKEQAGDDIFKQVEFYKTLQKHIEENNILQDETSK